MRWNFRQADEIRAQELAHELSALLRTDQPLSLILTKLLLSRGINTLEAAQIFLSPSLDQLHSPYLMTGMKAAVERLDAAIERKEGILVYGDYDVDGTTAVVILKTALELCGGAADFHVPHRTAFAKATIFAVT